MNRYQTMSEIIAELNPSPRAVQVWLQKRGVFLHRSRAIEEACLHLSANDEKTNMLACMEETALKSTFDQLAPLNLGSAIVEKFGAIYIPQYGHPGYSDLGEDLAEIRQELLALPWITKRTARHEYFMSEVVREYTYGTGQHAEKYESRPFTDCVLWLMDKLNRDMNTEFNVCFLNKYDDEKQHLGWHADEFPGMRSDQPIGVMSFGAEREIWVRPKMNPNCPMCSGTGVQKQDNGGVTESVRCQCLGPQIIPLNQRFKLEEASLFLMPPGYQDTHQHRIPKHDRPCGWRISLTFRSFN